MNQQLVKLEPVSGEITRQEASHSESQQTYAIPGGQTHEATRDASQTLEAKLADGGQMKQAVQEHQFQAESESVKQLPGGGVSKTAAHSDQHQQQAQSVSSNTNTSADGLRTSSTQRTTQRRVVQKSSQVKQSSSVSSSDPSGQPQPLQTLQQQEGELQRALQQQQHRMKDLEQDTVGVEQLQRQADEAVGADVLKQTGSQLSQQKTVQTQSRRVVQQTQQTDQASS